MTAADRVWCDLLPEWSPMNLARAVEGGPLALLEGTDLRGERYSLVGWGKDGQVAAVEDAAQSVPARPPLAGAPLLLWAWVGSLDWDGTGRFWRPAHCAFFQWDQGLLWWRGTLPVSVFRSRGEGLPGGKQELPGPATPGRVRLLWDRSGYCAAVRKAQRQMAAGRVEKVILSVPMEMPWEGSALAIYERLTAGGPPGLRFLLDSGDGRGALVGISPEPLVKLWGGHVTMRVLAGTRKNVPGAEAELTGSVKDREEHRVAVQQARRDLLTVCRPESVTVTAFMEVERHPGLVHLASSLEGRLAEVAGPGDLVRACFPAGTVGGIPRREAMNLIDALEPLPRGWYAGALGTVLPGGNLDLWLTIRSVLLRDRTVQIRTGAGLVRASDPEAEWQECMNKAAHTLAALGGELGER